VVDQSATAAETLAESADYALTQLTVRRTSRTEQYGRPSTARRLQWGTAARPLAPEQRAKVHRVNLAFTAAIIALTAGLWAGLSRPSDEAPWPATVSGFAFSPLRAGQNPADGELPSLAELDTDLRTLARHARSVRSYSLDGTLQNVAAVAATHGLDVTLGVPLGGDMRANDAELRKLRAAVEASPNVSRVIVGNETLLRGELSVRELGAILDRARAELGVEVGTAEPWHLWIEHPELAAHVDFIAVHLLPYWEGVHVDHAVGHIVERMSSLRDTFPEHAIVIGEVGWPSWGRSRGDAVASHSAAAKFWRRFLERAEREGYEYFLMEAFDQPWKRWIEGDVGAYWGVFDADRRPKFAFDGPVAPIPAWRWLALLSALAAGAAFCASVADGSRLRATGRAFLAMTATVLATAVVATLYAYTGQYWSVTGALGAAVLFAGLLGLVALTLVEAHEWAEARWSRRCSTPRPQAARGALPPPKVSIHVPVHREPPEMVAETLRALAALDYPSFEVLVIDNNTDDEGLWRPVEAYCERLGPRFQFFRVTALPGYKAGALNFALRHTAPDAAVVAVVDSDYKVEPDWLRALVPLLGDPGVAIVQAPQDYRDGSQSVFKAMCDAEYRGFFKIGMVTRHDRNAIIQHGTMTLIRRAVLEEVGGWSEWTVTEDAELGLRVLEHGYRAVYSTQSFGRGLTPDNFLDYKTQRFRWALGAVQILRRHRGQLLGTVPSKLSLGQRYHFVAGWLAWLADGLNLLFNIGAVGWSAMMIVAPERFLPPLGVFSAFAIALFGFKLLKIACLYRSRVGATAAETLGAVVAGLALVHVAGRAVLAGLVSRRAHFCRTPKLARNHSVGGALAAAAPETALAAGLVAGAAGVAITAPFPNVDRALWCLLLAVFAVPHLAALALSLTSALRPRRAAALELELGNTVTEARRG
jgi:exo-beta-1,3-glucanase (GH17 family)/cellulose synthase/poly-beta-1,6-N-acetylglucosamine synthase-like glycosyltransferase